MTGLEEKTDLQLSIIFFLLKINFSLWLKLMLMNQIVILILFLQFGELQIGMKEKFMICMESNSIIILI